MVYAENGSPTAQGKWKGYPPAHGGMAKGCICMPTTLQVIHGKTKGTGWPGSRGDRPAPGLSGRWVGWYRFCLWCCMSGVDHQSTPHMAQGYRRPCCACQQGRFSHPGTSPADSLTERPMLTHVWLHRPDISTQPATFRQDHIAWSTYLSYSSMLTFLCTACV